MSRNNNENNDSTDFATVESYRNDLTSEEFPEGPYGADLESESLGKSKPWRMEQRPANPFGYENRQLHAGMDRDYPGDFKQQHPIPEVQDEP
jgi:hypothetical protein